METKCCKECGVDKPLTEYHKMKKAADGYQYICRACNNRLRKKYHRADPRLTMVQKARMRAKAAGVPFSITKDDFEIPSHCPALGVPLEVSEGCRSDNSPTLDRIIPDLGYVPGNIAVLSYRANRIKNDATYDELMAVYRWMCNTTT